MRTRKNAATHCTAIVIEFHFHECRTDARNLSGLFLGAGSKAGHAPGKPAQKSQSCQAKRDGHVEAAANAEHTGQCERAQAPAGLELDRRTVRADVCERVECP